MNGYMRSGLVSIALLVQASAFALVADENTPHPNSTLTQNDVALISKEIDKVPLAEAAVKNLVDEFDLILAKPIDVPVPKDAGGGYTHEQHKRNYLFLYNAGLLYQITQGQEYLSYARNMLLRYAELYPKLGIHPKPKEQTPGKLFWQSLNEAVWLVHTIQAYDMVISGLSNEDRKLIETDLLRPVAHYLSAGQPQTFNKIHNHGTWAAAAVGMTGYVLRDERLVKQALYGLDMSGDAGFLKQIETLFSPDGYYAEGPYYQRYALMPFVLFAKAIEVNTPELKIFEYRDRTLLKAIRTAAQLSYNTLFFAINDAIKDKGIDTIELVHAIAIAFEVTGDQTLLSIAEQQNKTLLTGYGFRTAKAIGAGLAKPFQFKSMQLRDGQNGDQGGLAIFRNGIDSQHQALVMKNTSQGLGHGHFDKLHWLYFDNGNEIVSDYGAARFLNIEAKYGGHYLPENNAWAKQTIAHNTVVVDQQSQFDADWKESQKYAPQILFFETNDQIKITSAKITQAYPGTELRRTMAMVNHDRLAYPLVIDIFELLSDKVHQYDLPLHYHGQIISHNLQVSASTKSMAPLGKTNGYQFLWDRARGKFDSSNAQVTWLNDGRFYTYTTLGEAGQELIFAQLGANDPNFNLRTESSLINRIESAKKHTFVSLLEQHGEYNGRVEYTLNAKSDIADLQHSKVGDYDLIDIELGSGGSLRLVVAGSGDKNTPHSVTHNSSDINWTGHFTLIKN